MTGANSVLQLPASDGPRELDAVASLSPCRRTMGTSVGGTADPGLGGPRAEVPGPVAGEALGSYPEAANCIMNSGQTRWAFGPVHSATPCSFEGTALNVPRYGLWGAEIALFGLDEFCEINSISTIGMSVTVAAGK